MIIKIFSKRRDLMITIYKVIFITKNNQQQILWKIFFKIQWVPNAQWSLTIHNHQCLLLSLSLNFKLINKPINNKTCYNNNNSHIQIKLIHNTLIVIATLAEKTTIITSNITKIIKIMIIKFHHQGFIKIS